MPSHVRVLANCKPILCRDVSASWLLRQLETKSKPGGGANESWGFGLVNDCTALHGCACVCCPRPRTASCRVSCGGGYGQVSGLCDHSERLESSMFLTTIQLMLMIRLYHQSSSLIMHKCRPCALHASGDRLALLLSPCAATDGAGLAGRSNSSSLRPYASSYNKDHGHVDKRPV